MLKPDDPVWTKLIEDIKAVASLSYAEDPEAIFSPEYVPASEEEPGFAFAVLTRPDRQYVLADAIDWRQYGHVGISHAQQEIIVDNVLDGKPQGQWLDGVFDELVLENDRILAFKMSVQNRENSPDNHVFDEMDGDRVSWTELSAAAKLDYIAGDAARTEVGFEVFAEVARDVIGANMDAALRIVLEGQKELHAIGRLLPDDGRTEPIRLVEQVKELLDYKAFHEILQGDQLKPQDVRLPEQDARATARADMLKPDDPAWGELVADLKAIVSCEDEYPFTSMHRTEQWDLFTTSGFYSVYMDRGMTEAQITRVISNVINGKPQEKWLEGILDLRDALGMVGMDTSGPKTEIGKVPERSSAKTFRDVLRSYQPREAETNEQEPGGRER